MRDGGREEEGGRLLSDGRGGEGREERRGEKERERVSARENSAGVRGDSIMMQRWRGGGTLELARALAIGRSANHSFGNNRLHTLHTKDTREPAKNCPEWGCSLGPDIVHLRCRPGRKKYRSFTFARIATKDDPFFFPRNLDSCVRTSRLLVPAVVNLDTVSFHIYIVAADGRLRCLDFRSSNWENVFPSQLSATVVLII